MRRRELHHAARRRSSCRPLAARAQQPAMPVVGFLEQTSPDAFGDRLRAFRQGLKETGIVEGENVAIEYRWAENQIDRLPAAGGRIGSPAGRRDRPTGAPPSAFAAKAATTTIPIVFIVARRPGQAWACRQPRPAGRQRDRDQFLLDRVGGEAAGTPA